MRELFIERKTAIEAIHFCGHTPLYIETEPEVKDEAARDTMNKLVADADGFISIYYLSEGRRSPILNNLTPIEYELVQFLNVNEGKKAPVMFFKQKPDKFVTPSPHLEWFEDMADRLSITPVVFDGPGEIESEVRKALAQFKEQKDLACAKTRFTIRYVGPDFIGLIGKLSEVVFTGYRLNIDYISHAARGGRATTYVSCSPRVLRGAAEDIDPLTLQEHMRAIIEEDFRNAGTDDDYRLVDGSDLVILPDIKVDRDLTEPRPYQFFTEVRTIDAPGQLTAICKEFRLRHFNIDEFQLRPSPPEHPRQTTMSLWVSKPSKWATDRDEDRAELERSLRYLIGVRAFTVRVM